MKRRFSALSRFLMLNRIHGRGGLELWISGGSRVSIGYQTYFNGHSLIACLESTTVDIGERCLFSDSVTLRTGDSHAVLDVKGNRTNPSRSIVVGKHVWVGHQVIILKGSSIADDSVVGSGTLIAGQAFPAGSEIVGNPARILKAHINWTLDLV